MLYERGQKRAGLKKKRKEKNKKKEKRKYFGFFPKRYCLDMTGVDFLKILATNRKEK